jgi:hypothetical protein
MTTNLAFPPIASEDYAQPQRIETLGANHAVTSRVTVGRSDALHVTADEVITDRALSDHLRRHDSELALVRLAFRLSFRPAPGELFETALFSVVMTADGPDDDVHPFVRTLAPDRLASGPFIAERGLTVGLTAGVPGVELAAEGSTKTTAEITCPYVVAAGLGEADPEWRYTRTATMELIGSHEMGLVAEYKRGVPLLVSISVQATVATGRHRTNVTWKPRSDIARWRISPV